MHAEVVDGKEKGVAHRELHRRERSHRRCERMLSGVSGNSASRSGETSQKG